MASEFEAYRESRLKLNAYEYGRFAASDDYWECPSCGGKQFFISDNGVECSNCGQEIGVNIEVE